MRSSCPKTRVRFPSTRSSSIGEAFVLKESCNVFFKEPLTEALCCRFFKKRQQEKQKQRPRSDGDKASIEDVDDDEFEKVLGQTCLFSPD